MKKIKHSKYKNTGILFEMLVRQVAADTMHGRKTKALPIIKRHFKSGTELGKELQLYRTLQEEEFKSETSAQKFLQACVTARKSLNEGALRRQKYNLIKEINDTFIIDNFFKSRVSNYNIMAAAYKLFEYAEVDNPAQIVRSKATLVEHVLRNTLANPVKQKRGGVIKETYAVQPKDVRLLSYKMLIDKFNDKYNGLNQRQKNILREYINNVTNTVALKEFITNEIPVIQKELKRASSRVGSKIVKIKLNEVNNMLSELQGRGVVKDKDVLTMLRYYELIKELKKVEIK
jgi:hypothetical protein|tara:strand:- start:835 stop:1701 length:867 start_codon:yes stop_codon:yes gene_type:complete